MVRCGSGPRPFYELVLDVLIPRYNVVLALLNWPPGHRAGSWGLGLRATYLAGPWGRTDMPTEVKTGD